MTIVLDQFVRLFRGPRSADRPRCIVCRQPIRDGERRLTVRGSVQVHQGCATYRMWQVDSGAGRVGYPLR